MLLHEIRRNYSTEMLFEETTTNTNVVQFHWNVNFFAIFLLSVTLNARYGYSLTQFLLLHCLHAFAGRNSLNAVPCYLFILIKNKFDLIARNTQRFNCAASNSTQTAKIALNLNNNVSCGDATKTRTLFVRQVCPCVPYRNILKSEENMENLQRLTEINKMLLFWKTIRRKMIRRKMPDEPGWCIENYL